MHFGFKNKFSEYNKNKRRTRFSSNDSFSFETHVSLLSEVPMRKMVFGYHTSTLATAVVIICTIVVSSQCVSSFIICFPVHMAEPLKIGYLRRVEMMPNEIEGICSFLGFYSCHCAG